MRNLQDLTRASSKFLAALQRAEADGTLARDPAAGGARRAQRRRALLRRDWVVFAKSPLAGPAAVLDYLSRYTHRTAIGAERLVAIRGEQVLLRVRADDRGATTEPDQAASTLGLQGVRA